MEPAKDTSDIDAHIEREVQRRLARHLRENSSQIAEQNEVIRTLKNEVIRQHDEINSLTSKPLTVGTLLKVHTHIDPSTFRVNDEVRVVDPKSSHYGKGGVILGTNPIIDPQGCCYVKLVDDIEERFGIGMEGKAPAQIVLTTKKDGTWAIVQLDGKPWEINGIRANLELKVGDLVKINPDSKVIVGKWEDTTGVGPICTVIALLDGCIEASYKGDKILVYNPNSIPLKEGDRVVTDPGLYAVIKKLPQDCRDKYKITSDLKVTWDDIGGLDGTKQELKDALELPFKQPKLFEYYGVQPIRGILLYGPPGVGKTLMARVAARAMADLHGKEATETGYIYVKAPEILDKWVGNSEKEIVDLFERGRNHYREHGYKAILAIDEADAIMPQRGTRRSSDISDTLVPMFLGEMDGVDPVKTQQNPIVILLTNRADVLDPAVTRPGRISRHIKVSRPTEMTAIDILEIHTKNVPFEDEKNKLVALAICASDLFGKSRLLYRINGEYDFTIGDCVNGAMLANIAEIAKMNALHRDLSANTKTGVNIEDFRNAVQKVYEQQQGLNVAYDIQDFCDKVGIQISSANVERCFGAA